MDLSLDPERDSDNTDSPKVVFAEDGESIVIKLSAPNRTIQFSKVDLLRAVRFLTE